MISEKISGPFLVSRRSMIVFVYDRVRLGLCTPHKSPYGNWGGNERESDRVLCLGEASVAGRKHMASGHAR